jgi:hypothetical protein
MTFERLDRYFGVVLNEKGLRKNQQLSYEYTVPSMLIYSNLEAKLTSCYLMKEVGEFWRTTESFSLMTLHFDLELP